jgi:hypothetical protein
VVEVIDVVKLQLNTNYTSNERILARLSPAEIVVELILHEPQIQGYHGGNSKQFTVQFGIHVGKDLEARIGQALLTHLKKALCEQKGIHARLDKSLQGLHDLVPSSVPQAPPQPAAM